MVEGLLLISTCIFWLPRSDTLPSISTDSMGTRFKTSEASPPRVVASFSALYMVLSTRSSTSAFWPVTVTSFSTSTVGLIVTLPRSISSFLSPTVTRMDLLSKPMNEITTLYLPAFTLFMVNFPLSSHTAPSIGLLVATSVRATIANSTGLLVVESITVPIIRTLPF